MESEETIYGSCNVFRPHNVILRNVLLQENKNFCLPPKYKTIHKFRTVTPDRPVAIRLMRAECMPKYRLTWTLAYGVTAHYEFLENGRNGDNDIQGIQYHAGFWAKIRKILDLQ